MKLLRRIIFLICVSSVVISPMSLFGRGPGTSGGAFLRVDIGARPVGMGGVFCGIADDVNAIHYNPAGLIRINRKELMATHNEWIEGIRSEFLGYVHPISDLWSLGLTLNYLHVGGLVERDIYGNESGKTFGSNAGAVTFAVGRKVDYQNLDISVGTNFKIVQETIKGRSGFAYCVDVGAMLKFSKLSLGIVVQNLGTSIKLHEESFPLPLNFKLGFSYNLTKNIKLGFDINKPVDNEFDIRAGGEYWFLNTLALRIGYKFNRDENTGIGISAGVGFKYSNYQIDYAFMPYGLLGNTHRISFSIKF